MGHRRSYSMEEGDILARGPSRGTLEPTTPDAKLYMRGWMRGWMGGS